MLDIRGLTKSYGHGVYALRGVTLSVPPGVFGLLGPNGAGKSTLMKMLATLLEPDAGTIGMSDVDFIAQKMTARRMLGYLPQDFGLYPTLTAEQTLGYFARLKGVYEKKERTRLTDALLERVNLSDVRRQRVGGFSGGMRQRLGIAQAMIGSPKLIIVDEPTAGLDPAERHRFHNLLAELATGDTVVLLSTHIVTDVSTICGAMAIIRGGQVVALSTPSGAIASLASAMWEASVPREQVSSLRQRVPVISAALFEGRLRVRVRSDKGCPGEGFRAVAPTLEDFYFSLVPQSEDTH